MLNKVTFRAGFSDRLKAAKVKSKMTEDQITYKLNTDYGISLSKSSVNNHLNGAALPDLETLFAYCEMFEVPADYLLFAEGDEHIDRPDRESFGDKLNYEDTVTALEALATLMLISGAKIKQRPTRTIELEMPQGLEESLIDKNDSAAVRSYLNKLLEENVKPRIIEPYSSLMFEDLSREECEGFYGTPLSPEHWHMIISDLEKIKNLYAPSNAEKYEMMKKEIAYSMKTFGLMESLFCGLIWKESNFLDEFLEESMPEYRYYEEWRKRQLSIRGKTKEEVAE